MSKSEPLVSSLNRLFKTKIKMLPLSLFFLPMSNPIYQQCLLLLPSTYVPDPATSHHLCHHYTSWSHSYHSRKSHASLLTSSLLTYFPYALFSTERPKWPLLKYISVPRIFLLKGENSDTVNDRCWGQWGGSGRTNSKCSLQGRGNKANITFNFNGVSLWSSLSSFSCRVVSDCFAIPWTVACQAPSVHGISQARILKWAAIFFPRGSSWPKDWTQTPALACGFFTTEPPGRPQYVESRNAKFIWEENFESLRTSDKLVDFHEESYL